jgi:uncharacterized membrane protein
MPTVGTERPASLLRLDAIDVVRGGVMILMVLDHTRQFVHAEGLTGHPLDLATTTVPLYLTRWITHLCAPAFVLCAGLGIGLRRMRAGTQGLPWFVFSRGLWLLSIELTLVRALAWFNLDYTTFFAHLQVVWAIGASMMVLSLLVRLPVAVVAVIGALLIAAHNALDAIQVPPWHPDGQAPSPGAGAAIWMLLHQTGFFSLGDARGAVVWADYPLLPWLGVMCVGYAMSRLYAWPREPRRRALVLAAFSMPVLFVLLRTWNIYGDPRDWAPQPTLVQSAMSFMKVMKYGPSLDFVLVTLAPSCAALAALDGRSFRNGIGGAVVTFGRVPFFFYLLQWVTAHASGMIVTLWQGGDLRPYFIHPVELLRLDRPPNVGAGLAVVYVCWIVSLLVMYPLCRWFAGVKARRREWWLSYL